MTMFLIGGGKDGRLTLEPIGREKINVYPGGSYHYGHSSSPDPVWVESVEGEWVTFYKYPYGPKNKQREQLVLFKSIAEKGTATKLAAIERYAKSEGEHAPEWAAKLIAHYSAVLAGKQGDIQNLADIRMVKVEFSYAGAGDGWSEFEKYYPHSVSSSREEAGKQVYDSFDFSAAGAAELAQQMNSGAIPGFAFVRIAERD